MAEYQVIWEGRVREVYIVEARDKQEARETWMNYEPVSSESFDGAVELVMEA